MTEICATESLGDFKMNGNAHKQIIYFCKMPKHYFQFKQFKINQEKCAMKVCTDACLFGALISEKQTVTKNITVLDIGAGTGLLSVMFAQKNNCARIDAVEIDKNAFEQATQNIEATNWKDNIHVFHQSVQEFAKDKNDCYDLIFSNPPFYENDLKSADEQRNTALHSSELTMKELIKMINRLLKNDGCFCVLLPYSRMNYFLELAEKEKLFLFKKYLIKQTEKHDFFRCVLFLSKTKKETAIEIITIKEKEIYSLRFQELLKDYYLHL